jgi:hypothetical protein
MSISSVIGSLGTGLETVVQDVGQVVSDLLSTVESVIGGLTSALPLPASTGLSGLLASAPGGHSLALSVPGLVQHTAAAIPSVGGAHADALSGGHSVPFADNTVVSIAPIKHN